MDHVAVPASSDNHTMLAGQLNNALDSTDDYQHGELSEIILHQNISNTLELATKYTDGIFSWRPIDLVMDKDPHAVANYVMQNDLGHAHNNKYSRCAMQFLRSFKPFYAPSMPHLIFRFCFLFIQREQQMLLSLN